MYIKEIINQYIPENIDVSYEQYKEGAINLTYRLTVNLEGEKKEYILQKMSPIFDISVMEDIDFITAHLLSKNIVTQVPVRTLKGALCVRDGASWWRMLTYLPGKTFNSIPSPLHAKEAGRLVGEFHSALIDCEYNFKFTLPHYHDVAFDMEKLRTTLSEYKDTDKYLKLETLAGNILTSYDKLPTISSLPKRIIHGDLKITNVLFDESGKAVALIDLDTLSYSPILLDLGDALRSWCMPGGEDAEKAYFDKSIYDAALDGYMSVATFLTKQEKESIPSGIQLLALDLAARFATDAFSEDYFVLDSSKYTNLFDQNKKRAENQLAFFEAFSTAEV